MVVPKIERRGRGRPNERIVTVFHGKDKQFLSLVSSGDKNGRWIAQIFKR